MSSKCVAPAGLTEDKKASLLALRDAYRKENNLTEDAHIDSASFMEYLKNITEELTKLKSTEEVLYTDKLSVMFKGKEVQRDVVSISSLPDGLFNVVFKSSNTNALNSVVVDTEGKGLFTYGDSSYEVVIDTNLLPRALGNDESVDTSLSPSITSSILSGNDNLSSAATALLTQTIKQVTAPLVLPDRKYKVYIKSIFTNLPGETKKAKKEAKEEVKKALKVVKDSGFNYQYQQAKQAIGSPIQRIDSMLYSLVHKNLQEHPIEKVYNRLVENEGESDYNEIKMTLDRDLKEAYINKVNDLMAKINEEVTSVMKDCK